jgi:hypothetical protein
MGMQEWVARVMGGNGVGTTALMGGNGSDGWEWRWGPQVGMEVALMGCLVVWC